MGNYIDRRVSLSGYILVLYAVRRRVGVKKWRRPPHSHYCYYCCRRLVVIARAVKSDVVLRRGAKHRWPRLPPAVYATTRARTTGSPTCSPPPLLPCGSSSGQQQSKSSISAAIFGKNQWHYYRPPAVPLLAHSTTSSSLAVTTTTTTTPPSAACSPGKGCVLTRLNVAPPPATLLPTHTHTTKSLPSRTLTVICLIFDVLSTITIFYNRLNILRSELENWHNPQIQMVMHGFHA